MKLLPSLPLLLLLVPGIGFSALVAQYGFEEGSGAIAGDSASSDGTATPNDDGTIVGATFVPGIVGDFALQFDGSGDFVNLEPGGMNNDILSSTTAATFTAWLRLDSYPGDIGSIAFFSVPSSSLNSRGGMFISGSGFIEVAGRASDSDSFQSRISSTQLPLNEWIHVAGVLDYANEEVEIYFDGALQPLIPGSINFSASGTPSTLSLASTLGSTGGVFEFYDGAMDDVRIYNERLSPTGIRATIPEPSSVGLMAVAFSLAVARRQRVKKRMANHPDASGTRFESE